MLELDSVEPASDAINFKFSSEASCSARKRSPLSVQSRIAPAGADRRQRAPPPASLIGNTSPFACSDISDMPASPTALRMQLGKSTSSAVKFGRYIVRKLTSEMRYCVGWRVTYSTPSTFYL